MEITDLDKFSYKGFPSGWSTAERVFFSPVDNVHAVLIALITSAQHRISVNMYGYDDDEIDAVLRAKAFSPNIAFIMNLDKSQSGGIHERKLLVNWTRKEGTSIAIGESVKKAISHLKVCVIDGLYVISGSTNWSLSGESKQDNELLISRDPLKASVYESIILANHLEMLKQMGVTNG